MTGCLAQHLEMAWPLVQCRFGLELDLHPCYHCGVLGQDALHEDCTCGPALKYDCPCNPDALAFPLYVGSHSDDYSGWIHPQHRSTSGKQVPGDKKLVQQAHARKHCKTKQELTSAAWENEDMQSQASLSQASLAKEAMALQRVQSDMMPVLPNSRLRSRSTAQQQLAAKRQREETTLQRAVLCAKRQKQETRKARQRELRRYLHIA
jgi:hypothetical protein